MKAVLFILGFACVWPPMANARLVYAITDLGTLPGKADSFAYGINNHVQIAGFSYTVHNGNGVIRACLWDAAGIHDLGTLPGGRSSGAWAINDRGEVVGWSYTSSGSEHACLWDENGAHDLGALPGSDYGSGACGVNNNGQTVGYAYLSPYQYHAVLWDSSGIHDLGTLPEGFSSTAVDINDNRQIVGWSDGYGGRRACLWDSSGAHDLGALPTTDWHQSFAQSVNNRGYVVGYSATSDNTARACLWDNVGIRNLGTFPGWLNSFGCDINDSGLVVGYVMQGYTGYGYTHAFVWDGTSLFDLDTPLGWYSSWAYGINNHGHVVGNSTVAFAGYSHAILWTPMIRVTIDLKPGEYPNTINLRSKGVVPVAVLSIPGFDADTVDPPTVRFCSAEPLRWHLEDVDRDSDADLLFYFGAQSLDLNAESTEGTLTGRTTDGDQIVGADSMRIVSVSR
ncbi:MAG: DUF3466 family protein [Armatimonadota bacterium]|nr:DUF3466 family protein [Armatimonadota bacterium]